MSELINKDFRIIEKQPTIDDFYSHFLKQVIEAKNKMGVTSKMLAKAFNCSGGKIHYFETEQSKPDYNLLEKYCGFFGFKLELFLREKSYSEKVG